MRKEFGEHAEYQQSRPFREPIHSGRLTIKHSADVVQLVKQHTEYYSAVQIVSEREQKQENISRNPMQEEQQAHPSSSSSLQWDGSWTSSW